MNRIELLKTYFFKVPKERSEVLDLCLSAIAGVGLGGAVALLTHNLWISALTGGVFTTLLSVRLNRSKR